MRLHRSLSLLLAASISLASLAAAPAASSKAEVEQLLARLASSGCQFQRNGWHSATEARSHLQQKYRYLIDRKPAASTEEFISLAATKSSTSGKPYSVKCADQQPVPSATWMAAQLKGVRAGKQARR